MQVAADEQNIFNNLDKSDGFSTPIPFRTYLYTDNVNSDTLQIILTLMQASFIENWWATEVVRNRTTYPCSTLVFGLCPDTDSELSVRDGTTAKNLQQQLKDYD